MPTLSTKKEYSFFDLYDRFLKDSRSGRRLQPNGKKLTAGTINNYYCTKLLLEKFCKEKEFDLRIYSVKRITQRKLQVEKNYWLKFYKKFTDYLYLDCGHYDNYVGANIKNIRTFFGYLNKQLLLNVGEFYKQFYVRKEEVPIIALLPEELNFFIYDKLFEEKLTPQLKKVKDFFVFGCTVGLRFSDLITLKSANIHVAANNWYLSVRSKKTLTDTRICLPDYAVDILLKYRNQKGNYLLPKYNMVNMNLYLKKLHEKAGFIDNTRKIRNKRGVVKEILKPSIDSKVEYRFCDLVTTHTMRRTAITIMLCLGMPEYIVRKISGHSPMSKEFFRYVSLAQSYQDNATIIMFKKLKTRKLEPVLTDL